MITRSGTISDFCLKLNDLLLLVLSLSIVIVFRYSPASDPTYVVDYFSERIKVTNAILGVLLILTWYAAFAAQGLYTSHRLRTLTKEIIEIARAIAVSTVALLIAAEMGQWPSIKLRTVAEFGLVSFALVTSVRMALRYNLRRLRERGHNRKSLVIVGGGSRAQAFAAHMNRRHDLGYKILGYVDSDSAYAHRTIEGSRYLGTIEDLSWLMSTEIIDEVAIALPIKSHYSEIERAV